MQRMTLRPYLHSRLGENKSGGKGNWKDGWNVQGSPNHTAQHYSPCEYAQGAVGTLSRLGTT
jgi:hypothetical protein